MDYCRMVTMQVAQTERHVMQNGGFNLQVDTRLLHEFG